MGAGDPPSSESEAHLIGEEEDEALAVHRLELAPRLVPHALGLHIAAHLAALPLEHRLGRHPEVTEEPLPPRQQLRPPARAAAAGVAVAVRARAPAVVLLGADALTVAIVIVIFAVIIAIIVLEVRAHLHHAVVVDAHAKVAVLPHGAPPAHRAPRRRRVAPAAPAPPQLLIRLLPAAAPHRRAGARHRRAGAGAGARRRAQRRAAAGGGAAAGLVVLVEEALDALGARALEHVLQVRGRRQRRRVVQPRDVHHAKVVLVRLLPGPRRRAARRRGRAGAAAVPRGGRVARGAALGRPSAHVIAIAVLLLLLLADGDGPRVGIAAHQRSRSGCWGVTRSCASPPSSGEGIVVRRVGRDDDDGPAMGRHGATPPLATALSSPVREGARVSSAQGQLQYRVVRLYTARYTRRRRLEATSRMID